MSAHEHERSRRRRVAGVLAGVCAAGATCLVLLLLASTDSPGASALLDDDDDDWSSVREPFHPSDLAFLEKKRRKPRQDADEIEDPDPPDWCEAKANNGHCDWDSVAKWCTQICEAYDGDADCLQSHLDIECSKRSQGSVARISDAGMWACWGVLDDDSPAVYACVNDAGHLATCAGADESIPPRVPAADVDAALAAIVSAGGCDERPPDGWDESHARTTPDSKCTDFIPWDSGRAFDGKRARKGKGMDCSDYSQNGWCAADKVVDADRAGRKYGFPEEHCCVCGGGNTYAPPVDDELACDESELALRLALAAYYNGTILQRYLPEGTSMAGEYHTREGGDGFVALAHGACWMAFRGSQEEEDWVADVASVYTSDCRAATGEPLGRCGTGFFRQWESLRRAGMLARARELAGAGRCPKGVLITGHSLGGALASLAAADVHTSALSANESTADLRFPIEPAPGAKQLRLYTFGEPRAFEWYAADWYNENIAKVRWLNWGDAIPASPPPKWGFKHWGHAYEIRSDYMRFKHTWKRVPQNFGSSGLLLEHHEMDSYIHRLTESCRTVLATS